MPRTEVTLNPAEDVLFVGLGATAVNWYRCVQPALALGADWIGVNGDMPKLRWRTGLVKGNSRMPEDFGAYRIVVLQQPAGSGWVKAIRALQKRGTKVIYEIDDYLHAVPLQRGHAYADKYTPERLREFEMCMEASDAMIVSTEYLAKQYANFAKRIYVCENGIDLARYNLTKPKRETVNIVWAGATGHNWETVAPWLQVVLEVMKHRDDVCFISIGQSFANALHPHLDRTERSLALPFTAIEQYPSAMTMGDIALAPAGKSAFYRAKSDLRWLEAGALGIPVIADPLVYKKIRHGVNGFQANTPQEFRTHLLALISDEKLRTEVGGNARRYVEEERSFPGLAKQWAKVFKKELRK